MNRKLLILPVILLSISLQGQKIHTKEVKETFANGVSIFSIITDDIKIKFSKDLDYYWYNEFSGSQSSKGTSGGYLLHGKSSMFNEEGRLVSQCFYKYGLQDSTSIVWDENGVISSKYIFKNGIKEYQWDKMGKYIFESYGSSKKPAYKESLYTLDNKLISEVKCISENPRIWELKYFYESNNKLKTHSFLVFPRNDKDDWGSRPYGEYKEFFESGSLKCSRNYDKKYKLGHEVGLWYYYNEGSGKIDTVTYKLSEKIINSTGEIEIGTLVYQPKLKDWVKTGFWYNLDKKGNIINESNMDKDSLIKTNQIIATEVFTEPSSNTIKLIKTESGLLEVPLVLNGVLKINFIFDSGASEVSLSPDVALTLIRTGTVTDNDFLPDQTYMFADGSSAKSKRFLIKKLIIGNQTLTNIEASISNSLEAPMLIGQNVMNRLGSITIDYENLLLIIKPK